MWASTICDRLSAGSPAVLRMLFDAAFKGAVILLLAALITFTMRRASAAARHLVWFLGTFSLLILPLLSVALPTWNILPRWSMGEAPAQQQPAAVEVAALPQNAPTRAVQVQPDYIPAPVVVSPLQPISTVTSPPIHLVWQAWVIIVWAVGTIAYLGFVLFGSVSLWLLQRRSSRIVDGHWTVLLRQVCEQLGFRRSVRLISSSNRTMPMTWGMWRTRILLPGDYNAWTPEQCRTVLLHELAHARRWDCLTQLFAQIACACYWFNPLVWIASRNMQTEREQACDDLVLSTGTRASAYAEQLLHIAAEMPPVRFSAAAIAMARPGTLESRLRAILDTTRNRGRLTIRKAIILAMVIGVSATVLATLRADDASPTLQAVRQWANHYGYRAQLIEPTNLESKWGSQAWTDLPFTLTTTEDANAKACVTLSQKANSTINGKSEFSNPATRDALQEILKNQPNYFYAEFLLSLWHRDQGDLQESARLLDAAYQHAPAIIVQRFEFADGSPLANVSIASFALECNRVQNGWLDPSLKLEYPNLRTDTNGCIYLPVYHTVYRADQMSYPQGYDVRFATLGWFKTSRTVGLLPSAIVTAKPGDFVVDPSAAPSTVASATLPGDNAVELLAISPYPDPQNQWWLPDGSPSDRKYETGEPGISPWPAENGRRFVFRFSKALDPEAAIQFRFSVPTTSQTHYTTVRNQDLKKPFVLFTAFPTHPDRATLRMGQAAGDWKSTAEYDPHTHKTTGNLPAGFAFKDAAQDKDKDFTNDFTQVIVAHPKEANLQCRVFAIDSDQKEHATGMSWFSSDDTTVEDRYRFEQLPLAKIDHFRLESREYHWVEFSNIALNPGAAAVTQPAVHAMETTPNFDHGGGGISLVGIVRFRAPDAAYRPGPWFTMANSADPGDQFQLNPLNLGLAVDAPIEEIVKRTKTGDLYEPELGVIQPVRGTLMAPIDIPPDKTVVEQIAFEEGVATMTCEQIARQVAEYARAHPQTTQWHIKDGEHYALLRTDGGLSVMDVHGSGNEMYVGVWPIGKVTAPAEPQKAPSTNNLQAKIRLTTDRQDGDRHIYRWSLQSNQPARLLHGWYSWNNWTSTKSGEHVGGGSHTSAAALPAQLGLDISTYDGLLDLKMLHGDDKNGFDSVESKTRVPVDAKVVMRTMAPGDISTLDNHRYLTLWMGQWIRKGQPAVTVRYLARLADDHDPATGFFDWSNDLRQIQMFPGEPAANLGWPELLAVSDGSAETRSNPPVAALGESTSLFEVTPQADLYVKPINGNVAVTFVHNLDPTKFEFAAVATDSENKIHGNWDHRSVVDDGHDRTLLQLPNGPTARWKTTITFHDLPMAAVRNINVMAMTRDPKADPPVPSLILDPALCPAAAANVPISVQGRPGYTLVTLPNHMTIEAGSSVDSTLAGSVITQLTARSATVKSPAGAVLLKATVVKFTDDHL